MDLPPPVEEIVESLATMPGAVAVVLGGSRAMGESDAGSDWDLGVYYRGALETSALAARGTVHPPGTWGRIMNGGAWLACAGLKVDVLLRDLDVVEHWARLAEQDSTRSTGSSATSRASPHTRCSLSEPSRGFCAARSSPPAVPRPAGRDRARALALPPRLQPGARSDAGRAGRPRRHRRAGCTGGRGARARDSVRATHLGPEREAAPPARGLAIEALFAEAARGDLVAWVAELERALA